MRNFDETLARLAAYTLRRRVRRDQLRMIGLDLLELVHQPVEFGIADLGIVEHVVAVLVMANLIAKQFCFVLGALLDRFHLQNHFTTETRGTEKTGSQNSSYDSVLEDSNLEVYEKADLLSA